MTICYRTDAPAWHVIYTQPQCELIARDGIRAIGFQQFMPMERGSKIVRRRRVETVRPLFPRYLFVGVEMGQSWQRVRYVKGVEDVLCNNDEPSRVPNAWIDMLRKLEDAGTFDKRPGVQPFQIGETVRISDGPFSGLNAVVQSFITKLRNVHADRRAKVLLDFLGRQTEAELDVVALERV